eukprot:COSAG02_NODE_2738_length_8128_cov_10.634201_7_plen_144_part_01
MLHLRTARVQCAHESYDPSSKDFVSLLQKGSRLGGKRGWDFRTRISTSSHQYSFLALVGFPCLGQELGSSKAHGQSHSYSHWHTNATMPKNRNIHCENSRNEHFEGVPDVGVGGGEVELHRRYCAGCAPYLLSSAQRIIRAQLR